MKKMFFLFFMLIGLNVALAQEINVENKIISIPNINGFYLQGYTVKDNELFAILINDDESESIFKVFDLKTNKELISRNGKGVGHANDVTYNNITKKFYIVHGGGTDIVHVFDNNYNYIEDINVGLPIRSLTYVYDKDVYLARTVASGFIYKNDLSLKTHVPFITAMNFNIDIARQGWEYYDNYLYYANWSWIRLGGNGSNSIRVYDLNGNGIDTINTKDNIGELEDVAFYNNKMILGFNSYNNTIDFYLEEIPKLNIIENIKEKDEEETLRIKDSKDYSYIYFIIGFIIFFIIGYIIKKRL